MSYCTTSISMSSMVAPSSIPCCSSTSTSLASSFAVRCGSSALSCVSVSYTRRHWSRPWSLNVCCARNYSFCMSAPSGDGCVRTPIVCRKRAGAFFRAHHAPGRIAGDQLLSPLMVCRARAGAQRFVRLHGGALFFSRCHGRSVLLQACVCL